jgi:hypothetical protein
VCLALVGWSYVHNEPIDFVTRSLSNNVDTCEEPYIVEKLNCQLMFLKWDVILTNLNENVSLFRHDPESFRL